MATVAVMMRRTDAPFPPISLPSGNFLKTYIESFFVIQITELDPTRWAELAFVGLQFSKVN